MERKEAIEVVKKNYPHVNVSGSQFETALRTLIPELKESDGKKIRREILDCINTLKEHECFPYYKKQFDTWSANMYDSWIAWLEKQGKKTKPIEGFNTEFERQVSCLIASAMNKDYEYTKDFVKWTSEGLLNYAKLEIEKNSMGISEATKRKLEDNLNKALEKETPESFNEFLDEQGKQKEYTFKLLPRLLDMIEPTDRAKAYVAKLIDALEVEGYSTDAKIVREHLKIMNGEKVPMATMDEEPVSKDLEEAEKDLALTWEDISKIISIDQQVCGTIGISDYIHNHQQAMEEVLKRFKDYKK